MSQIDTYKTVLDSLEGEVFKDRGSKFIGYVFPVSDEDQELFQNFQPQRGWGYRNLTTRHLYLLFFSVSSRMHYISNIYFLNK